MMCTIYYHAFLPQFQRNPWWICFWLVWYNLLIQTGSNSSKQLWFLVSWLQHSKLNWFELTSKGQMKYLSTGTQSKACYQWHNPNHLDCVTTTMYGDQNPNWYLDCVSSVNPLDSDPSNTFGLWHPCPLVCVGTNSLDSVSFPNLRALSVRVRQPRKATEVLPPPTPPP